MHAVSTASRLGPTATIPTGFGRDRAARVTGALLLAVIATITGLHVILEGALWWIQLVLLSMLVLGSALAIFLADRIGFRRDDDPVSRLALVGALLGCVYLVTLPFYNGYERNLDIAADRYAVALTGDRISAIRGAVRGADQALQPVCPRLLGYWYFSTHPPAGVRIPNLQGRPSACR